MAEIDAKPGDYVKLKLAREEMECTILESYDASVILVKLKSGYNIGIPRENVYGVEVLKRGAEKKPARKIERKKGLPLIGLIVTGGTIASKLDSRTGAVSALTDVNEFAQFYPGLFEIANVRIDVPFMKLSENMNSEEAIRLGVRAIEAGKKRDIYSGGKSVTVFVVDKQGVREIPQPQVLKYIQEVNEPVTARKTNTRAALMLYICLQLN